jgi:Uma2 family endonuclease
MATNVRKLNYADYEKFPADGFRHELIEGQEFIAPAPEVPHQRVSRKLERILDEHVTRHQLGEVFDAPIDVVFSQEDVVQPDLIFISNSRAGRVTRKNIQGAPDLVIEILSPSTAPVDRGRKLALYGRADVAEYWIVDPDAKTVEVHEFGGPRRRRAYREGQSFESALLPGLTIRLADLF